MAVLLFIVYVLFVCLFCFFCLFAFFTDVCSRVDYQGQEIKSRLAEMESKLECFDKKINVVLQGGGVSIVFGCLSVTESS